MKLLLTLLTILCLCTTAHAQYDDRFYYPDKHWADVDTNSFEQLTIKTDTATLSAIILQPQHRVRATIIYFHGSGGNVTTYIKLVQPFVDAGFRVVMIDMQGYGHSTGTPTHLNIAADAQVAFNKIMQRRDIRKTSIIIMGVSMGSQVATKIAKDNNSKITALVLEGAISSFTDIAVDTAPEGQGKLIRNFMKSPYAAKDDIKGVTVPVLIIHSTEDKDVPYAEGKMVYDNANQPKELWPITGDHLNAPITHRDEYVKKLEGLVR